MSASKYGFRVSAQTIAFILFHCDSGLPPTIRIIAMQQVN